jgi:hypothetical protein
MVFEALARFGLQPLRQRGGRHTQHRRRGQCGEQGIAHRRFIDHQPDAVQAVFFLAQRFTQLALEIQVLLALRVAGAAGHADQQPLVFQRRQRAGAAVERAGRQRRQRPLRIDQLAKVAAAFRADHVVGEVRREHGRGAHQQHGQHFPAAGDSAGRARAGLVEHGHGMHRQAQGLVVQAGAVARGKKCQAYRLSRQWVTAF